MSVIPESLRYVSIESIILRFVVAAVLSGIIGLSRGRKQHAAGLRTHLLVCTGSACVMMINQYMVQYMNWGGDMGRMGAQVISGIGFLGAGTILVTGKKHIRGLTSAAGIWASACLGLAAGVGFYEAAVIMCIVMFIIISILDHVDEAYVKKSREVTVYIEYDSTKPLSCIIKGIRDRGWHVRGIDQTNLGVEGINSIMLVLEVQHKDIEKDKAFESLNGIEGVHFIERI